jgi:glycosyl transferase family 25
LAIGDGKESGVLEAYDMIRIVNLPSRADRRREMNQELRRLSLHDDSRVQYFDAVAPADAGYWESRGAKGCYLSHLAILREALGANASVLILEDDCDFTAAAKTADWGGGADVFYGGYGATDFSDLPHSNIQGSHCMGFSRKVLPSLVKFLENLAIESDPPPIDGAYVRFRRMNPQATTSFAVPQVAVQRQSASDIAPGRFDRYPLMRLPIAMLRRLNRSRYRRLKMREGIGR